METPQQNQTVDEKGILQPESEEHAIYSIPPDASPQERAAIRTVSRVNARLEQPLRPAKARSSRPKRKRRSRRKPAPAAQPVEVLSLAAHESRCTICCHEDRADIEEEFVHWHSPRNIAQTYDVTARAIYRHAHAFNLFLVRDRNLRFALGHIIDRVDRIPVMTPDSIVRAVHAFARVNNEGQWVEPPSHIIVSGSRTPAPPLPAPSAQPQLDAGDTSSLGGPSEVPQETELASSAQPALSQPVFRLDPARL